MSISQISRHSLCVSSVSICVNLWQIFSPRIDTDETRIRNEEQGQLRHHPICEIREIRGSQFSWSNADSSHTFLFLSVFIPCQSVAKSLCSCRTFGLFLKDLQILSSTEMVENQQKKETPVNAGVSCLEFEFESDLFRFYGVIFSIFLSLS